MSPKLIVLLIVALLLVIIVVQNTQTVTVSFLFWELTMSRVVLIVVTGLLGFVLGFVVAKLTGAWGR